LEPFPKSLRVFNTGDIAGSIAWIRSSVMKQTDPDQGSGAPDVDSGDATRNSLDLESDLPGVFEPRQDRSHRLAFLRLRLQRGKDLGFCAVIEGNLAEHFFL
jgi:hypothetical protein